MSGPLVLVQLDSLDPGMAREWMDRGELPTLAAIRDGGCHARIAGPEMIAELGSALSLFSGVPRATHGYYDYRQLVPGSYDLRATSASDARTEPFWARLARGRRVAAIDAAETYVYPRVEGAQLAYWTAHQASTSIVPPTASSPEVLRTAGRVFGDRSRIPEYVSAPTEADDLDALRRILERIRRKGDLVEALAGDGRHDLVVAGFFETHTAGHRFWRWRSRGDSHPLGRATLDVYRAVDAEVGRLVARLPADANVLVFTLYGLSGQYPTEDLTQGLMRLLGYAPAPRASSGAPSRVARRSPLDLARAAVPGALREAISRRLPSSVQERLLADAFRTGTDWSRTTAFAIPSLYMGFIRVNLRGREPCGIVDEGAEYEQLLDRIEDDFRALVDPITGESPIARVHRTARIYGGPTRSLPDLAVEWAPSAHFRERVEHPRAEVRQRPPAYFRDNYHTLEGMLLARGPGIAARGDAGTLDVLDFAPGCLALLGEPARSDLPGRAAAFVRA